MDWDALIKEWRVAWEVDGGDDCMNFLRFLYEPASYVHRSRLERLFVDFACVQTIAETRRGWLNLNARLLDAFRLNSPSLNGPRLLPRQRLIYDNPATLQRLANVIGALICYEEIQIVVMRGEHASLVAAIGEEAYGFAMRKTVFFFREIEKLRKKELPGSPLQRRVAIAGRWCLATCLHGLSADVRRRFTLKFQANSGWKMAMNLANEPLEEAWNLTEKLHARFVGDKSL